MKLIKHKTSGHECTVTDEEWRNLQEKGWAKGYKILQDAPEPSKVSSNFIPPEVKLPPPVTTVDSKNIPGIKHDVTDFVSTKINPTSPEEKTETPQRKKQQPKK